MEIDFPYNTGAIVRPTFEVGNYGRVHNFIWSLPLSVHARALLAWADSRPPDWIPRVDDIQCTFRWDDKQWRRIRKELESIGCITSQHKKDLKSKKSVHTLNIDMTALSTLAPEPPARNGGSRARPAKSAGSGEPPEMGGSRKPPKVAGLTTEIEPGLDNHHQPGGDQKDCSQVRSALAPSGAEGLGTRLAAVLNQAEQKRVDKASAGATKEQLQLAVSALRTSMSRGSVKSVAGLAVALGKAAVRGEVGDVATGSTPTPATDPWPGREARVRMGLSVLHSLGVLVAEPGARAWRHRGGERDGQPVTGKDALRVWERVESGELNPLVTT